MPMLQSYLPAGIFDYILLALLILGGVRGFSAGFVRTAISFAGFIGAWVVAGRLAPVAALWLDERYSFTARLAAWADSWAETVPAVGDLPLPEMGEALSELPGFEGALPWQQLLPWLAGTDLAATAVAWGATALLMAVFLGLLLVLMVLVRFLAARFGRLARFTPVTALGDRLLGAALGAVRAAAVLALVTGFFLMLPPLGPGAWFRGAVAQSVYGQKLTALFYWLSPWLLKGLHALGLSTGELLRPVGGSPVGGT